MNEQIVDIISSDLNIKQFENEPVENYGNRVLYSAIASWVRTALLGKSYSDINLSNEDQSVDIMHVISRLAPVAASLIESVPHSNAWFGEGSFLEKGEKSVTSIIFNMLHGEEIALLSNKRRLTISPERYYSFVECSVVLGGINYKLSDYSFETIGLTKWIKDSTSNIYLIDELGIPEFSSEWLKQLIKDAIWTNGSIDETFQLFNAGSNNMEKSWHKDAWLESDISKLPQGIHLIKTNSGGYVLVRKDNMIIEKALLDQWYIKTGELNRIMFALDTIIGKPSWFKANIFKDYVIINMHSRLPRAEETLILLTSWPYKVINDRYNRIIPIHLWDGLKNVLSNMGISWIEKNN